MKGRKDWRDGETRREREGARTSKVKGKGGKDREQRRLELGRESKEGVLRIDVASKTSFF
jgi:hypothetical protein